jgi:hypothetical protein
MCGVKLEFAQPGDFALLTGIQTTGWGFVSTWSWRDARKRLTAVGWSQAIAESMAQSNDGSLFFVIEHCSKNFYGCDRFSAFKIGPNVLHNWGASDNAEVTQFFEDVVPIVPEFCKKMTRGVEIVNPKSVQLLMSSAECGGIRVGEDAWLKVRHPASHKYPEVRLVTSFHTILGAPKLGQTNTLILSGRYANGQNVLAELSYPGKGRGETSIIFVKQ